MASEEIHRLRALDVQAIGTLEWFSLHQDIMSLHGSIVSEMQHGDQSVTARMLHGEEKTVILLQEIINLSVWKKHVLPEIKRKDSLSQVFPIYSILFYESVCSSVLLSIMYCHDTELVNMFEEEVMCELIDHCVEHIVHLIGMTNKKKPVNLDPTASEDKATNVDRINHFERDLQYQVCNILLSLLRLIIDHLEDLSLSILTRIVQHHDVAMLLVHLVENQAWFNTDSEGNQIKYNDTWTRVKPEDRFILGKYEAQVWKMLLDLLMHPKCAELYEVSSYRKNELLKLEKHLHEIIIDQFPTLQCFRQWFAQLKMTNGRHVTPKPLILEVGNGSIREKAERHNWESVVTQVLDLLNSEHYLREVAAKHSDIYGNFEKIYAEKEKVAKDGKETHLCGACQSRALFKCSRCKQVWYCNKTCQIKHWDMHRKYCSV